MNNLISKAKNSITSTRNKFVDALLGKAQSYEQPQMQVGQGNAAFTDALMQDPDYIAINADIKNPNKQLKLDQIYQGLNHGSSSIAKLQQEYGVKTPQTKEEIELAKKLAFNSPSTITSGIANKPERTGGFLNNINKGYNENYNESFKPSNLELGENKGLGYRIGEAAGTLGRFANSSLGRGLMTAAIVGATGGSGLEALAYGGQAGLINQVAKKKDSLYRNELLNSYKQSIMNNDKYNKLDSAELKEIENYIKNDEAYIKASNEEEKNKIAANLRDELSRQKIIAKQNEAINNYTEQLAAQKGFINDDMYKNILNSQQLRDNAEYRKMYYDAQQANLKEQMEFRRRQSLADQEYKQQQLAYQKNRDAIDNAFKREQLAQGWAKIYNENNNKTDKTNNYKNLNLVQTQLERFEKTFEKMPGKLESNTLGRLRNTTGFETELEANFNSQRQLLFNKIARDLGGEKGVLSDQDIKRIENSLPKYTDSLQQKKAKMKAIYDLLNDRLQVENIALSSNKPQLQNHGATQIGNFKVRVK